MDDLFKIVTNPPRPPFGHVLSPSTICRVLFSLSFFFFSLRNPLQRDSREGIIFFETTNEKSIEDDKIKRLTSHTLEVFAYFSMAHKLLTMVDGLTSSLSVSTYLYKTYTGNECGKRKHHLPIGSSHHVWGIVFDKQI